MINGTGNPWDDAAAWAHLESQGFTHDRGLIYAPRPGMILDDATGSAIDYLCYEWDWAYLGSGAMRLTPKSECDMDVNKARVDG